MKFIDNIRNFGIKSLIKSLLRTLLKVFVIGLITVLLLEVCFRFQVIDYYSSELEGLNSKQELESKGGILVIGDSFSANPKGYIGILRDSFPNESIINCAVPGTGIRQHMLFASSRITKFKPRKVIYQMYVGNDFSDLRHPTNFSKTSWIRNFYWIVSDRLLFLRYINRKTAGLRAQKGLSDDLHSTLFDPKKYNNREKIQFAVAPSHINDVIMMKPSVHALYQEWRDSFKELVAICPNLTLLIIPHCAQVNSNYLTNMETIGAQFDNEVSATEYPLLVKLREDFPTLEFINPLELFQKKDSLNSHLYYDNDPHLTSDGNQVLAKYIKDNFLN